MNAKFFSMTVLVASSMVAQVSTATLMTVSQSDFSGSSTVIDFNDISAQEFITAQYNGLGVTFSGALLGLVNTSSEGDTELFNLTNPSTIASNWDYRTYTNAGPSWTATFSTPQNLVGFRVETKAVDDVTIEAFMGDILLGSINFPNPNGDTVIDFIGVHDAAGFNRMTVTTARNATLGGNGFFAMDDFRFESTNVVSPPGSPSTIPVPPTIVLLLLGLAMLNFVTKEGRVRPGT